MALGFSGVWLKPSAAGPSRMAQTIASSISSTGNSSKFTGPSGSTSSRVTVGPASAPSDPPAAMKPYSRLPWSLRYRSARYDQNTGTAKIENTVSQTKKTCGTMVRPMPSVSSSPTIRMLDAKK